ncbi:TetR/AcrR family transcriptional regulator [Paenibacillus albiflavus]|uniref:TetR/AcrR family transcriptional regulator n=1 Tax=Paenibacillus albiflavus TaxID=2545760 RepID=A0A4R4EGU9_9BACL|nr:TetR/AcrR family transcriptional regulator [Paenibacillus albiflavus]TCZ79316.1 TetR/AcrR family transcriptional regulator [Paenibacillus albiflavus]
MKNKQSARERILQVASELFYKEGVRAVGIDRVIEESGVAKASFYRSFASKDDLIVNYLEQREELSLNRLEEAEQLHPDSPKMQLLSLIDSLAERMNQFDFRGCPFMNVVVEFPDSDHPGHQKAVESRQNQWKKVEEIIRKGGAKNPEELTSQLRMLYSGAIMVSYVDRHVFNPEDFLSAVRILIDRQM